MIVDLPVIIMIVTAAIMLLVVALVVVSWLILMGYAAYNIITELVL